MTGLLREALRWRLDRSGRGARGPPILRAAPSGTERRLVVPVSRQEVGLAGKILVVDDDASVQRLLQHTLEQEGYEVVIAGRRGGGAPPVAGGGRRR